MVPYKHLHELLRPDRCSPEVLHFPSLRPHYGPEPVGEIQESHESAKVKIPGISFRNYYDSHVKMTFQKEP